MRLVTMKCGWDSYEQAFTVNFLLRNLFFIFFVCYNLYNIYSIIWDFFFCPLQY